VNDLDIRAMAAATYNEAYEAVESLENPAWAVELAATSLNLWRRVGKRAKPLYRLLALLTCS
jgi:hypothetical protein